MTDEAKLALYSEMVENSPPSPGLRRQRTVWEIDDHIVFHIAFGNYLNCADEGKYELFLKQHYAHVDAALEEKYGQFPAINPLDQEEDIEEEEPYLQALDLNLEQKYYEYTHGEYDQIYDQRNQETFPVSASDLLQNREQISDISRLTMADQYHDHDYDNDYDEQLRNLGIEIPLSILVPKDFVDTD